MFYLDNLPKRAGRAGDEQRVLNLVVTINAERLDRPTNALHARLGKLPQFPAARFAVVSNKVGQVELGVRGHEA